MSVSQSMIMPPLEAPLKCLTRSQHSALMEKGYIAIEGVVPTDLCRSVADTIRTFIGADDARPDTWYRNKHDIYVDVDASGKKPHHGPCGMVQLTHHDSLWKLRQLESIYGCFSDAYGTDKLWVTCDRAHFKPPQRDDEPAWSDAGLVHSGLHWDTDVETLPIPFALQGVVYLEDTAADQGALHVVPGSHLKVADIRDAPNEQKAVPVPGPTGTLVMWCSATLHGPGPNISTCKKPRVSAYVAMLPVDAGPYLPPNVRNDTPLSLADAGTLIFEDKSNAKYAGLKRLDRMARMERWRSRLPLLNEDPKEGELSEWPPNEQRAPSFAGLTPLGRKLVGLDEW